MGTVSLPELWVTELGGTRTREDPRQVAVVIVMITTSLLAVPDYSCLQWTAVGTPSSTPSRERGWESFLKDPPVLGMKPSGRVLT